MSSEKTNSKNIGLILLAAGESSRLGTPKQLLLYNGQPLLQYVLKIANDSNADPAIIVLGAYADIIKKKINTNTAKVIINNTWQEGMASSIRVGIKTLLQVNPSAEGAVLMVCDQPYVTSSLLNDLIESHKNTGSPIITCSYANTFGPPTLFHKTMFPELLQLKGDVGARSILKQHANKVEAIPFAQGDRDIDTITDYEKLSPLDL